MSLPPNGLARAAIRFKPASFAGTFVALMMTALIVAACGILLETGLRASVPPSRYERAPVVVAADQKARLIVETDGERVDAGARVTETARLDAALVRKAAAAPGVAAAVPDVTFPAQGPRGEALTAHGWGSAAFTDRHLAAGAAPRDGEVVLDAATARTLSRAPGDRVNLTTAEGTRPFRVAGVTAAPDQQAGTGQESATVWFADSAAPALAGHPGRVDAVAVLPTPGTGTPALATAVRKALDGTGAVVHTGDDRSMVESPALAEAQSMLTALGGSFGGVAAMVAVFTAAGTVALSVGQRAREFALLRAIGATPRQIRRSIATEALLVAPLAAAVGVLPGIGLAAWWLGELKDKGAVPHAVDLAVSPISLGAAAGAVLLTALLAGRLAARRPSRIRPGEALGEANVPRLRIGPVRTPLGLVAVAGGVVLAAFATQESGEDAANAALGVVMLFMLAVALLGPLVARACAQLIGLPLRAAGAPGDLAAANSRANSRRLASAITPIVLAMAFASTLVFLHTSQDRATERQQRAGLVADRVVTAPAGLPADAAERAAAVPGVRAAVGVHKAQVLAQVGSGGSRVLQSYSAQALSGDGRSIAAVQDLDVRAGSLAALGPDTVAVAATLADSAHAPVGGRIELRLPDGTKVNPKVVATYARGLGLAEITLPRTALAGHTRSPFDSELLVAFGEGADPGAVTTRLGALGPGQLAVTDPEGHATAQALDRELNKWANTTMAAVLGGFAAVAAVNTLVMTILDRRRELGTLRLVGTTRRQVLRMVRWEALLVAVAGIALGTGIAMTTLVPMARGITGENPYVPPLVYGAMAGAVLVLGVLATTLPARVALRAASAR
ncbi:FtsX-like permease family protein [Streptomyces sp. URMC 123]|uniref:FtsX-like permease family protein n=1 Tax=Streptomyces sp. URMC 123 TaxID=3423403 RepID=UPI003F1A32A9